MYRCNQCGNLGTLHQEEFVHQRCQLSQGEACDPCRKLAILKIQISDAQRALEDLLTQHRELKSKINETHNIQIHQLPTEIFALIFQLYVDIGTPRAKRSALTLGAVCQIWRRIAWSTFCLWSSLSVVLDTKTCESHTQLAMEWLDRSGQLPLSISLKLSYDTFRRLSRSQFAQIESQIFPLIETLNQCSTRWYFLDLCLPFSILSHFRDDPQGNSILRRLDVESMTEKGSFSLRNSKPEILNIRYISLRSLEIDWSNIKQVYACPLDFDEALEIIRQAPQMTSCYFESISERTGQLPVTDAYSPVIHAKIESFRIYGAIEFFLIHTTFPALAALILDLSYVQDLPAAALTSFLERSMCPLVELSLTHTNMKGEDLILLARAIPSLKALKLCAYEGTSLGPFYHALCNSPTHTNAERGPLLPSLEEFILTSELLNIPAWDALQGFFNPPGEAWDAPRRPLRHVYIFYERLDEPIRYMDAHNLDGFKDLMSCGLDLKIEVELDDGTGDLIQLSYDRI